MKTLYGSAIRRLLLLAVVLCALTAPASAGLFDLSDSQAKSMGDKMMSELRSQYALYTDWEINDIGKLLAKASGAPQKIVDIHVIPDPQVNAFAMPGGHVMIYEGLLDKLSSEDEISFVMGHEMGHILKGHIAAEYRRENENRAGISLLLTILGAKRMVWDLADFMQFVTMNQYSQKKEREADVVGYQLTGKIGFDPEAAITALDKLRSPGEKEPPKWQNKLFGTHPLIAERTERLKLLPEDRASVRPTIQPPALSTYAGKTVVEVQALDAKGQPWEEAWGVTLDNEILRRLQDIEKIQILRPWELTPRRIKDEPKPDIIVTIRGQANKDAAVTVTEGSTNLLQRTFKATDRKGEIAVDAKEVSDAVQQRMRWSNPGR